MAVRRSGHSEGLTVSHLTYPEAGIVGLIQGVTELFPISSLGHNVLIPQIIGGSWAQDLNVSAPESPYLAYIVGLHVATAIAMIIYFWRDWVRIIGGFFSSIRHMAIRSVDEKMAWMIIFASIPVGIAGVALEHLFRVAFSKPVPTALFLTANGIILFVGDQLRKMRTERAQAGGRAVPAAAAGSPGATRSMQAVAAETPPGGVPGGPGSMQAGAPGMAAGPGGPGGPGMPGAYAAGAPAAHGEEHRLSHREERAQEIAEAKDADQRLSTIGFVQAVIIGATQIFALLPGISRDGIVMVGGMFRGLTREDAARFSFLLSAPVILAAGMLKIPDLFGPMGNGIHGQIVLGSILSFVGAYLALRFFMRYIKNSERTLTPFAIYCVVAGIGSFLYLTIVK
jgi:undecaprenyl-diphosphatase